MTISSTTRTAGPFVGNGATTTFPFAFKVFTRADVVVALTVTATGVETIKTLDSDYTVALNSNQNSSPGGVITMAAAPPAGTTLAATSNIPMVQALDLTNQGGFYPKTINDALDRVVIQIQQLAARVGVGALNVGAAASINQVLNFISVVASAAGSALIGYMPGGVGAFLQTLQTALRRKVYVSDFLPAGFNTVTTDCTPYIRKAINYAANSLASDWWDPAGGYTTPRVVEFDKGVWLVLGTIYVPSGIILEGNKSTLRGSGYGVADNTVIESGYVNGDVVESNIPFGIEVNRVVDAQIRNFRIVNCYKAINLKNFNENCSLSNIVFSNCRISVKAFRCFYAEFSKLFSRSDAAGLHLVATEPSYWFQSSVNAITAYKVSGSGRKTVFLIDGAAGEGTRGMNLDGCSAEECEVGVQTLNQVEPLNIQNCYFENCSVVAVDLYYSGVLNVNVNNNWFGSCAIGVRADTILGGTIGDGNTYLSCPIPVQITSNTAAQITVEIPPLQIASSAPSLLPALPSGYALGEGVEVLFPLLVYSAGTGRPLVRQNYPNGLLPLPYSGAAGAVPGKVAFCDTTYSGGTVNYNAYIDTRISFDDYAFLMFRFDTADSNFADTVCGRIYGTNVFYDRQDHGKTVVVSNNAGYVRLTLGVFNGAGGVATVTGIVRHA